MKKGFEFEWEILCANFGEEMATKITECFSGCIVYFPTDVARAKKTIARKKNVLSEWSRGNEIKQIAIDNGITAQQVRNILKNNKN